jgi:hypothetical protein
MRSVTPEVAVPKFAVKLVFPLSVKLPKELVPLKAPLNESKA